MDSLDLNHNSVFMFTRRWEKEQLGLVELDHGRRAVAGVFGDDFPKRKCFGAASRTVALLTRRTAAMNADTSNPTGMV